MRRRRELEEGRPGQEERERRAVSGRKMGVCCVKIAMRWSGWVFHATGTLYHQEEGSRWESALETL